MFCRDLGITGAGNEGHHIILDRKIADPMPQLSAFVTKVMLLRLHVSIVVILVDFFGALWAQFSVSPQM
jgi:hypothetical protein